MLYIVATPLGNLEDMSSRALRVLNSVHAIVAESPRDSLSLIRAHNIERKPIIKYNEKNAKRAQKQIEKILESGDVAYISSAGTPGVSDPGADIVSIARNLGIKVCVIPGPSSLTSAIALCGTRINEFHFVGFFPKKEGQIKKIIQFWIEYDIVGVFFESTYRIKKTIEIINKEAPDVHICLVKEISKIYERCEEGSPNEILSFFEKDNKFYKGEFVVILMPQKKK